jgi:hypothetical protein
MSAALLVAALASVPFSVHVSGRGPDVLLVPGLACSAEVWNETAAHLAKAHRVHAFTLAQFASAPRHQVVLGDGRAALRDDGRRSLLPRAARCLPRGGALMEAAALGVDVTAAARGDRGAYRRLVEGHKDLVASLALAIVGDVHSSEDVAEEVFVHVWRSLPRLRSPHSFLPWLRQLTRNRPRKWIETRGRTPWRLLDEDRLLAEVADARPRAARWP